MASDTGHAGQIIKYRNKNGFTPVQWAILKNVWTLDEVAKDCVTSQTFYQLSTKKFLAIVDQDHPIRDFIWANEKKYEVCYIDTGFSHIEGVEKQNKAPLLAICLRTLKGFEEQEAFGIALVRIPFKGIPVENYPVLVLQDLVG